MTSQPTSSFRASYDSTTTKLSGFAAVLLIFIIPFLIKISALAVVGALIVFIGNAWSPRHYSVAPDAIFVHRFAGAVRIPLEGLREVRRATLDDFSGVLRLWGSGGLFGYYGLFSTAKLGNCSWYAAHRENLVIVATATKTSLFSPDDVDGFLEAIRATGPAASGAPLDPETVLACQVHPSVRARRIGITIGALIGLAGLGFAAFAVTYDPGPPSCTLTSQDLTIDDRFYPITLPAESIDLAHARIIDFNIDTAWCPTDRTDGWANSHYHSGWFRTRNGERVRLYRASSTRLVLLPPKDEGVPVILEAPDPDKFLSDLHHAWGR